MNKSVHLSMAEEVRRQRDDLQRQVEELKIVEYFHLKSAGIGTVIDVFDMPETPLEEEKHSKNKESILQILESVGKPMIVKDIVNLLSAFGVSCKREELISILTRHPELFTRFKGRWMLVKNTKGTNHES